MSLLPNSPDWAAVSQCSSEAAREAEHLFLGLGEIGSSISIRSYCVELVHSRSDESRSKRCVGVGRSDTGELSEHPFDGSTGIGILSEGLTASLLGAVALGCSSSLRDFIRVESTLSIMPGVGVNGKQHERDGFQHAWEQFVFNQSTESWQCFVSV